MTDLGDCHIRTLPFPNRSVKAVTFPNDDGTFDVYLNALYPEDVRREALDHELRHIRLGHFYSDKPLKQKEDEADGLVPDPNVRTVPLFRTPEDLASWLRNRK